MPRQSLKKTKRHADAMPIFFRLEVKEGRDEALLIIDLGRMHASPLYDISEKVERGIDGNPTYDSMSAAFDSLATDIDTGAYETP